MSALNRATIVAAYTDPDAVIIGTVTNWVIGLSGGLSTMDRLRARALEGLVLVQAMIGGLDKSGASIAFTGATIAGTSIPAGWIDKLKALTGSPALDVVGSTWRNRAIPTGTVQGWGAHEAARGALMHQMHHHRRQDHQVPVHRSDHVERLAQGRSGQPRRLRAGSGRRSVRRREQSSFTNQAGGTTTTAVRYRGPAHPPVLRPVHRVRGTLTREVKMVKRLSIILALTLAMSLLFVGAAYANFGPHGGYVDDTDACAGCHRAHTSFAKVGWTDSFGVQHESALARVLGDEHEGVLLRLPRRRRLPVRRPTSRPVSSTPAPRAPRLALWAAATVASRSRT